MEFSIKLGNVSPRNSRYGSSTKRSASAISLAMRTKTRWYVKQGIGAGTRTDFASSCKRHACYVALETPELLDKVAQGGDDSGQATSVFRTSWQQGCSRDHQPKSYALHGPKRRNRKASWAMWMLGRSVSELK